MYDLRHRKEAFKEYKRLKKKREIKTTNFIINYFLAFQTIHICHLSSAADEYGEGSQKPKTYVRSIINAHLVGKVKYRERKIETLGILSNTKKSIKIN